MLEFVYIRDLKVALPKMDSESAEERESQFVLLKQEELSSDGMLL